MDIVTDDMPFLVDSVTMELARHGLDSDHILHPQLLVRRDVTGTLHDVCGTLGGRDGDHDEIAESWTHIEISGPGADGTSAHGVAARNSAAELEQHLHRVLHDVRVAVEDYPRMQAKATWLADRLAAEGAGAPTETVALLRWLADNHFTFLGYREYDLVDGPDGMALLALPGTGLGILRHDKHGSTSFAALPPEVRARARDRQRLILTKANSRSTVHRPTYLDYIAVKRVNDVGEVVGEHRFLGLFTHAAYHESITRVPVLRRKLASVLEAAGMTADSHDGQDLTEILEGYPREELFQISVPELTPIALGVLALRERRQTRLFLRRDVYGRYMSCLVYLPRDRYTTAVRLRAQDILRDAFHGATVEYSATVGDSALARLHVVVRAERGRRLPQVDTARLEARLAAAVRSWEEDLAAEARGPAGRGRGRRTARPLGGRHPGDLQDRRARGLRGERPDPGPRHGRVRHDGRLRPVGGRGFLRRDTRGRHRAAGPGRPAARLAADDLPDRVSDHPHRCASPAPPPRGRGGGRAPVRVLRARPPRPVLDLRLRAASHRRPGRQGRGHGRFPGHSEFPGAGRFPGHGAARRARRILARSKPWSRTRSTRCGAARSRTTGSTPWCWTPT